MTKREALNFVMEHYDLPQDVAETFVKMVAQLDKANERAKTGEHKPTKTQQANETLKADVLVALADGRHATVTELIAAVPSLNGMTTQKVSALMRLLKLDGKVDKETVKGKTYFFMV